MGKGAEFPYSIVKAPTLTGEQHRLVDALASLCRRHDGLEVPVYIEPAREGSDACNQFLHFQDETLVGFASASLDDPIEVLGMVHPDYRRTGIGRALVGEISLECHRRGQDDLLLVCEEASLPGQAFADAMGARYDFSEYRMLLDRRAFREREPLRSTVSLHAATLSDLEALVTIRLMSFDGTEEEVRGSLQRWLREANQKIHVARVNDEPIGTVRVATFPDAVFINGLGVLPEYRGRGFGRSILVQVVNGLLQENRERIMLEVVTDNRDALSLYQSSGFHEVATYRYYRLRA